MSYVVYQKTIEKNYEIGLDKYSTNNGMNKKIVKNKVENSNL